MSAEIHQLPTQELYKDAEPLIPDGKYDLQLTTWETRIMFGKAPKLIIWFIGSDGEYAGAKIPAYYNVKRTLGKAKKKGGFTVGKKSRFAREYFFLMDKAGINQSNLRLDRLPISHLKRVQAKVRTVKEANNKPIPEFLQYSVIDSLLNIYGKP